jgi:archaemetzincin
MNGKPRPPRRRFDSAALAPPTEPTDLPVEPLPPEPNLGELSRPAADAPIVLVPIGQIDERPVKNVLVHVEGAFARQVVLQKALPVPKYAYNPSRSQYHSAAILKRVEHMRSNEWDAIIGIADVDLFVPEVPFVFGEADRSTRSAVISMVRLRPEIGSSEARFESLCKRLTAEIIHQLGLIRGLAHCPNNRCVMFLSNTVQDTDKKGAQFCANCRKRLASEC